MACERVFVVDRAAFFGGDWPHGFQPIDAPRAFLRRALQMGRFVDRAEAEQTPDWKQWIPYCVLRCGDWGPNGAPSERGVFAVQRTKGGGEKRLHESWSVGLGGHVDPTDEAVSDPTEEDACRFFERALGRELCEELSLPAHHAMQPRLLGLINDDTTKVGEVHAGLAYCLDWPQPLSLAMEQVAVREVSKMQGGFTHLADLTELWQTPEQIESWSRFLIEAGVLGVMGSSPHGIEARSDGVSGLGSQASVER